MTQNILIVDDEESIRFTFENFLSEAGYTTTVAASYDEAISIATEQRFDLFFVDIIMNGKSGIELLERLKKIHPNAHIIMITGAPSVDSAAESLRFGAMDYLVKPIRQNDLIKAARLAFQHIQLSAEKDHYHSSLEAIFSSVKDGIISIDPDMRVVDVNNAAIELCAFTTTHVSGSFIADITDDCSCACFDVLTECLTQKQSVELRHVECKRKTSMKQVVSISASPLINSHNQFTGCVMILRDETRLLHLEQNHKESHAFNRLIGNSEPIQAVKKLIKTLADVDTTVLITGESGTGKEITLQALHSASTRARGPLVKVNCGALADSILESELFGHVQGAFTGAVKNRIGRFDLANGGIIFLDEIGEVSLKMQVQLLRVLETMSFERVGSSKTEQVDVRVVAATNKDLNLEVREGRFRKDLFYRLKVMEMTLPPLRERKDDLPLLTRHFIAKFNRKFTKDIKAVSSSVKNVFDNYAWPGNIRELENCIEHAFVLCDHHVISTEHLPKDLYSCTHPISFDNSKTTTEARTIKRALEETGGNKTKAARLLSISRRTIYRKIHKYDIA